MESDKKKKIMEAAAKSFALFGYKATTMDQVAKLAKVGKGTIYTYFSTKEILFNEIVENIASEMRRVAQENVLSERDFITNLHHALNAIVEFREQHELTIKLYQEVKEIGTPAVGEALDSLEMEICNFIEANITNAIENGELRKCNAKITAFLMFKSYIALVYDWNVRHEPLPKEEVAQLINLIFMEGLSK